MAASLLTLSLATRRRTVLPLRPCDMWPLTGAIRCRPGWRAAHRRRGARGYGRIEVVTRIVHVPYVVERDEDGVWCASAQLRPGAGAVGDGPSAEAAVADLRGALETLLAEVGPPEELTLTLDVA